jgi:putative ABC transport system permease protein
MKMGNIKTAFFLAYKSVLRGSRWTLVLIILVTSLSFSNLILTPALLSGVTSALNQQQIDTLFGNIVIDPPSNRYYLTHISQIEAKLNQIPEISGAAPHLNNTAFFEYNWQHTISPQDKGQTGNWSVIGINPEKENQVTTIHESMIEGSYLERDDLDKIILGVEVAGGDQSSSLPSSTLGGVKVGDKVRLTYLNSIRREYIVKGLFKAREGGANNLAFVSDKEMISVLGSAISKDTANQILVRTKPGVDENLLIADLKTLDINGQIRSWEDYGSGVGGIVSSFGVITSIIGAIGLIVAGVVMFIVIYINVSSRKRQIGILRAIGVNRGVVMLAYLLQALLYAGLGIIFGGLILGYGIKPYFDTHPIDLPIGLISLVIDPSSIINAILWLIVAGILAGIIPVLHITNESIIKSIWGN